MALSTIVEHQVKQENSTTIRTHRRKFTQIKYVNRKIPRHTIIGQTCFSCGHTYIETYILALSHFCRLLFITKETGTA